MYECVFCGQMDRSRLSAACVLCSWESVCVSMRVSECV